jgi:hypothetical protein
MKNKSEKPKEVKSVISILHTLKDKYPDLKPTF